MAGDWGQSNANRMQAALEALRLARQSQQYGSKALGAGISSAGKSFFEAMQGLGKRKHETGERLAGQEFTSGENLRMNALADVRSREAERMRAENEAARQKVSDEAEMARLLKQIAGRKEEAAIYAREKDRTDATGRLSKIRDAFLENYARLKMNALSTDKLDAQIKKYMTTATLEYGLTPEEAMAIEQEIRAWLENAPKEAVEPPPVATPIPRPKPTPMPQPEPDVDKGFGMTIAPPAEAPSDTASLLSALEKVVPRGPKAGWIRSIRIDAKDGQLEPHSAEQLAALLKEFLPQYRPPAPVTGGIHFRGME